MNAIRTFATPNAEGTLTIQVPEEYREQFVKIIILPVQEFGIPRDKYFFENLARIQTLDKRNREMNEAMSEMALKAAENGLSPEILADLLNDRE